jgi:hypothetical protein
VRTAPRDRILLTISSINLAEHLSHLMESLSADDPAVRQRIEVKHVHPVVAAVRKPARESFNGLSDDLAHDLMRKAVTQQDTPGLLVSFYQAEWQEVVQEREALTEEAYLQVDREGAAAAGSRAGNASRSGRCWMPTPRRLLVPSARDGLTRSSARAISSPPSGGVLPKTYRAVIVDEAQDMGTPEIRFLLALVGQGPNALLLLGDTRKPDLRARFASAPAPYPHRPAAHAPAGELPHN